MNAGEVARAVGWSGWIGCLTGAGAAVLLAGSMALADGEWGTFVVLAAFMAFYGAPIGIGVGWVIGLPVAVAVGALRRRTSQWRGLGASVAGMVALVPAVVVSDATALGVLLAPAAAAGAWWGLGRVFDPPPVPEWLRTPSAHPHGGPAD